MAERSKALRQGRNLFGGVGSNPTLVTLFHAAIKQATGRIELPTLGLQDQCSATELSRPQGKEKATERIELSTPGLRDLCSATELSGLVVVGVGAQLALGAFSSVVERPFCIRKVEGSNPSSSTFSLAHAKSGHRESNPGFHGHDVVF